MSEIEGTYITQEEFDDADALLAGPSIEINLPGKVVQESNGSLVAKKSAPWIKISTTFRDGWLKDLKGSKLSVFLAIALHINEDYNSFPGIETIAKETGYSAREISSAVHELEDMGLLSIQIGRKKSNLYTVNAMVAYGKGKPSDAESAVLHSDASESCSLARENTRQSAYEVEPVSRTIEEEPLTIPQQKLQPNPPPSSLASPTAIEREEYVKKLEKIKKRNEEAYFIGIVSGTSGYAQLPEDTRLCVERVCKLWGLRPPAKGNGKSSDLAQWITSARDLMDACGEYGLDLLDEVHSDYDAETQNGFVPFGVNSPGSLVKTTRGKAAMKRQGISGVKRFSKPERQSSLDI